MLTFDAQRKIREKVALKTSEDVFRVLDGKVFSDMHSGITVKQKKFLDWKKVHGGEFLYQHKKDFVENDRFSHQSRLFAINSDPQPCKLKKLKVIKKIKRVNHQTKNVICNAIT